MTTKQELVIVFYEENVPQAVLFQNGHSEFFKLKKMHKDEIASLLGADVEERA